MKYASDKIELTWHFWFFYSLVFSTRAAQKELMQSAGNVSFITES